MALMKYRGPVSEAYPVDRLASEIFGRDISRLFGNDGYPDHGPRVNIVEHDADYQLEMQVPGFDKKDLKVEMLDDTLTIRGEHTEENKDDEDGRYTRREFNRTSFERSFVLPQSVNGDAIKADCTKGVLKLTIPKSAESRPKLRQIDIK